MDITNYLSTDLFKDKIEVNLDGRQIFYLFFGGALMDNVADLLLAEGTAGDDFGLSVSGTGDINGDGTHSAKDLMALDNQPTGREFSDSLR